MVYMPHEDTGKKRKLALPHYGPYQIFELLPNGLSLRPVDRPDEQPILVNQDRVSKCPAELPNISWLSKKKRRSKPKRDKKEVKVQLPPQQCYNLHKRT